jgi:hypothetical protein
MGKGKWRRAVDDVATRLRRALVADYVVLGGGNPRRIKQLPWQTRLGDKVNAFRGGFRLWEEDLAIASPHDPPHGVPHAVG